jgi:hypothetical protein
VLSPARALQLAQPHLCRIRRLLTRVEFRFEELSAISTEHDAPPIAGLGECRVNQLATPAHTPQTVVQHFALAFGRRPMLMMHVVRLPVYTHAERQGVK